MTSTDSRTPSHARLSPPWTDCGDPCRSDFGAVFAASVANGAVCLTFDRCGRRHALTLFDVAEIGAEIVIYGRRFTIVHQPGGAR